MKKNLTKEQIVETTLNLIWDKNDLRGLNLRQIARTLGCAHTNLYNYFPSYSDLLWETHMAIQRIFMEMLIQKINKARKPEEKLTSFFQAFGEMYLKNKGWFWLSWHENIDGNRPQKDVELLEQINQKMNQIICEIWEEIYGQSPDAEKTKRVLHNTHCYILGEISNHLLGRGLIEKEDDLIDYIGREATGMFRLCLAGSYSEESCGNRVDNYRRV